MYRQSLAHTLSRERPDAEIRIVDSEDLEQQMSLFKPDLLVCQDTVPGAHQEGSFSLVEILYSDSMDAWVRVNDQDLSKIEDIKIQDILSIYDETEKLIS
jgi:hypothetical protein